MNGPEVREQFTRLLRARAAKEQLKTSEYPGPYTFLLRHGLYRDVSDPSMPHPPARNVNHCYRVSYNAIQEKRQLFYMEGLACDWAHIRHHAWLYDLRHDRIIDKTWRPESGLGFYFGVPLAKGTIREIIDAEGRHGIFRLCRWTRVETLLLIDRPPEGAFGCFGEPLSEANEIPVVKPRQSPGLFKAKN